MSSVNDESGVGGGIKPTAVKSNTQSSGKDSDPPPLAPVIKTDIDNAPSSDGRQVSNRELSRDPGAPKRGRSAYQLYENAMLEQFRARKPELADDPLIQYSSKTYSELPPSEKETWCARAEADKTRYLHELASYVPPPGYDREGDLIVSPIDTNAGNPSIFKKEQEEAPTKEPTDTDADVGNENKGGKSSSIEPATDLKDVYEALRDLNTTGSTCTGGVAEILPVLPGLVVEGVGTIPLPLTQGTVEKLKTVAHQAPHGQGTDTVIDTSVRNTLQVDAKQVSLKNPSWPAAIRQLTSAAATALGVNANLVRPELYKLLLYETGGFFKKHRDTEKADGMFATLVVQLPSCFTGGSFVVSHNGRSKTFSLEEPEMSPYKCHYVAHYADCEHEILPVTSGYRLALVYSLCYTGSEKTKPSAQDLKEGHFVSTLDRFHAEESLFAVPMSHQYTTQSLALLGVGALKGFDRTLAQTISQAEGWDMIVAKAKRTDFESGDGSGYFDMSDSEQGEWYLTEMFGRDGGDAKSYRKWLDKQLSLESVEDSGMVLASKDKCNDMWGEGDSGAVQYTGNEGATRETTYSTCVLIAFSSDEVIERLCSFNISDAVNEAVKKPILLDHFLEYMKNRTKSITLTSGQFLKIYPLVVSAYAEKKESYWSALKILVDCLSVTQNVPAMSILASLLKENGWTDNTETIRVFLEKIPAQGKTANCSTLLGLVDGLLTVDTALEHDSPIPALLQTMITHFEKASASTSNSRCMNYQERMLPATISQRIVSLSQKYGWGHVASLIKPCFGRIRELNKNSAGQLAETVLALRDICSQLPSSDANHLRSSILSDFVALIETNRRYSSLYQFSSIWENPKIDVLVRELFLHGTSDIFQRIEDWASNPSTSASILSEADTAFQKINSASICSAHAAAKNKCVDRLHERSLQLNVAELKKRQSELVAKTRGGRPTFSWNMPKARTGFPAVDSFLRGDIQGPCEIIVGNGINTSERLASDSSHVPYGASFTYTDELRKGYSAEIRNTIKTGKSASVIVKKTKNLHLAMIKEFEENMKVLSSVRTELQKLGHGPSQPVQEPATKRARTEDVEGL